MKTYFLPALLLLLNVMAVHLNAQSLDGFYNSLTELHLPYNFSYEMHKHGSEVELPSSIIDQDPILRNFKAVGRVDLGSNNYFVIVKRIFDDNNDNVFFLLAINKSGQIMSGLSIDLTGDDGRRVDFKITEDKVIQIVNYDQSNTARIREVTYSGSKFVDKSTERVVTKSSLSGQ